MCNTQKDSASRAKLIFTHTQKKIDQPVFCRVFDEALGREDMKHFSCCILAFASVGK